MAQATPPATTTTSSVGSPECINKYTEKLEDLKGEVVKLGTPTGGSSESGGNVEIYNANIETIKTLLNSIETSMTENVIQLTALDLPASVTVPTESQTSQTSNR